MVSVLFNFIRGVVGADVRDNLGEEEQRWSEMPSDILKSISDCLSLKDYLVFSCVCKNWRFAASYSSHIIYFSKNKPWFMFYGLDNNGMDKCYLFSHSYPKCCEFRVPQLRGATCLHSKSGWLLAKRDELFFFCNPFFGTSIDLPEYPKFEASEQICTFSFDPTSPECTAFIISRKNNSAICISSCCVGDRDWIHLEIRTSKAELGTMRLATYCCDSGICGKKHSCCIFIHGSVQTIAYYLRFIHGQMRIEYNESLIEKPRFYKNVTAFHFVDWLDLFGETGRSISTYAVQLVTGNCVSTSFCNLGVSFDAELSSLKVVWIEPPFTRDMSEEQKEETNVWLPIPSAKDRSTQGRRIRTNKKVT